MHLELIRLFHRCDGDKEGKRSFKGKWTGATPLFSHKGKLMGFKKPPGIVKEGKSAEGPGALGGVPFWGRDGPKRNGLL